MSGSGKAPVAARPGRVTAFPCSRGVPVRTHLLIDTSASGDEFIATGAQLVPEDQNDNFNLFDVRVGGVQPLASSACSDGGCQGSPPTPPIFATPPSATFNGVGNFAPSSSVVVAKPKAKPLTRAQKLAKALKGARTNAPAEASWLRSASQEALWLEIKGKEERGGNGQMGSESMVRCWTAIAVTLLTAFVLATGGRAAATFTSTPSGFGFHSFQASFTGTQAGSHPDVTVGFSSTTR